MATGSRRKTPFAPSAAAVVSDAITAPKKTPWFHENAGLQSREYWAQLFTIVITTPINFIANKLWTFRHVRNRHAASLG